jgi:hypothetical protein
MASQTVNFVNPTVISTLQGQVGSTAGQVTTTAVNINVLTGAMANVATKYADKWTFPYGMGPYKSDIVPVQIKSNVSSLAYGTGYNYQGTGTRQDIQACYDFVIGVPSVRTSEISGYGFKTDTPNVSDIAGSFGAPYEDMMVAGTNMFFGGSTWAEGISVRLRALYEDFVFKCNSGTVSSATRNAALSTIQSDSEYIAIRDNIRVPSQVFKHVKTNTGSYGQFVYDRLLAMDGITPLSWTGATGTDRPVYMVRSTYTTAGNLLPPASNMNATGGKMGLVLWFGHATWTPDVLMGNTWLSSAIASMGYVCVQCPAWGLNQSYQKFNTTKTLAKMCADGDIPQLKGTGISPAAANGIYNPVSDSYIFPYDVSGTTYNPAVAGTTIRNLETCPVNIPDNCLVYERYMYEIKCALNQLGLAQYIDFGNIIVFGTSAGGSAISVIHQTLPSGVAKQLPDPVNPAQKATLFPGVKAIVNNTANLYDASYILPSGFSVGNTFNSASDGFNMKEAFAHWLPLKAPLISILGDGDAWWLQLYTYTSQANPANFGGVTALREFGYYNTQAQTVYQANNYYVNIDGNTTSSGAAYGGASFVVYYPASSHYSWQGPNAGTIDGVYGNSCILGQGFNCDLANGWKIPQQVQFPIRNDPSEAGAIPEIESLQYDSIKRFVLAQMLAYRYLGSEFPVNIEAFQTIGYKIDIQPSDCEQTQQTQWIKLGQQAVLTYDQQNVVLKPVPLPGQFITQAPSFVATGAGQSVAATSIIASTTGSFGSLSLSTGAYAAAANTVDVKIPIVVNGVTYYILASTNSS